MEGRMAGMKRPVDECVLLCLTRLFRFPGFSDNDITMSFKSLRDVNNFPRKPIIKADCCTSCTNVGLCDFSHDFWGERVEKRSGCV